MYDGGDVLEEAGSIFKETAVQELLVLGAGKRSCISPGYSQSNVKCAGWAWRFAKGKP